MKEPKHCYRDMQITIIEESDLHKWEEYLRIFSASPFLATAWLESFKNPNRIPVYLRFVSGEETMGLAAGLRIEQPYLILRKLYRIIFFFSGPAVVQYDKDLTRICMTKLISFATENGYTHLNFGSWDYPYVFDFGDLPFKPTIRKEYIMDMRGELSDIQKRMRKRIIEQVRQANRNGLTFHESYSQKTIEDLILLLDETKSFRLSKGYENYSYYYMPYFDKELLHKLFQNKIARIFYVQKEDNLLSVYLAAIHNNKACGLLVGANHEAYKLKAPAFIWFSIIEKLKKEGIESFNLGGVPTDSSTAGLVFFKTSLGAKEYICTGGWTPHLQSSFLNVLCNIYAKMPEMKLKKIIDKKIRGRSYS